MSLALGTNRLKKYDANSRHGQASHNFSPIAPSGAEARPWSFSITFQGDATPFWGNYGDASAKSGNITYRQSQIRLTTLHRKHSPNKKRVQRIFSVDGSWRNLRWLVCDIANVSPSITQKDLVPSIHPKELCQPSIPKDKENCHGRTLAADGAMGLRWRSSLASKLAGYSITLAPPLSGKSPSMTKIALA